MIFNQYAGYYDVFYKKKNYNKECDFLEKLFKKYLNRTPKTILDLGCGTGGHMISLARRGYQVTGLDSSLPMLKIAREKCERLKLAVKFYRNRIEKFGLEKKFDIVLCMFSVIDYLIKKSDLKKSLKNIGCHMKKDALFIFDFWNADAVCKFYAPEKKRIFSFNGNTVERYSRTRLFPFRHLCEVDYRCTIRQKKNLIQRFREKHVVRYFSIAEMIQLLKGEHFNVLGVHPFLNMNGRIKMNTWDVTCVCKKKQ